MKTKHKPRRSRENIQQRGLASRAGLRAGERMVMLGDSLYVLGGDVITTIDGKPVSTEPQIAKIILLAKPGQTLQLTIVRDGGQEEILLRLEEMH